MELLLPGVILCALAVVFILGLVRQRGVTSNQHRLIDDLEDERVEVEFVVSLGPLGRTAQITAVAEAQLKGLQRQGRRWILQVGEPEVDDTVLAGIVIADGAKVADWIARKGIELRDVISITSPNGERHAFYPEPQRRR